MIKRALFYVAILCYCQSLWAAETGPARLLVSKNVLNNIIVQGKDLSIEYKIYNVGESAATKVVLSDKSMPAEDFSLVMGSLNAEWQRIAPGTNVTHVAVVRPLKSGYYNFTSGEISYLPSEEAKDRQFGYTSAPGEGGIMRQHDYDRQFSSHTMDWLAFAVMCLPSLLIPYLLWNRSKTHYEQVKPKKTQ